MPTNCVVDSDLIGLLGDLIGSSTARLGPRALQQRCRHARVAGGRDRVDGDAIATQLERPYEGHAHQGRLRAAVIGLAEVAPQSGGGRDVDDAPVAGVLHERRRVARAVE